MTILLSAMKVSEKRVRNILTSLYAKLGVGEEKNVNQRVARLKRRASWGC